MPADFTISNRAAINSRLYNLFFGYHRHIHKTLKLSQTIPVSIIALISTIAIESEYIQLLILSLFKFFHNVQQPTSQMSAAESIVFKIRKYVDSFTIYFASRPIKLSLRENKYTVDELTHEIKTKSGNDWKYQTNKEWLKIYIELKMNKYSDSTKIHGNFKMIIFNKFNEKEIQSNDALINVPFEEDFIITPHEIVTIKSVFINSSFKDIKLLNNSEVDCIC